MAYIQIPYDIYESTREVVLVVPLWGIKRDSITVEIKDYQLFITGRRYKPQLKDDLLSVEENCYWGEIKTVIDLPPTVYFKDIHVSLSQENIMTIIVPKNIEPEHIKIEIAYEG